MFSSWIENARLTSLEAGVAGFNHVVTDKSDTREYFADMVHFFDPGSEVLIL